jgi:alpha-ketoglutarate-dependent taurine dioxygenase
MGLETTELTPRIGTQIAIDAETLLSGKYLGEIRDIFEQRGVVVFRDIGLSDEQQVEFSRQLGDLEQDIFKVTFDEAHNPEFAKILYGTWSWHIDRIDLDVPTWGSVLSPRVLAPQGGDTLFANTYAAWEDLPEQRKAELDGLEVIHTIGASYREVEEPHPGLAEFSAQFEPKVQPLVWRHRSGRKSLAIGIHACGVVGMAQDEADALLAELLEWAGRPQFVYRHQWRMGDMLMWNNTGTMHRATPFDRSCGRRLHRTTLAGVESLTAA